mmetsp:Transcript_52784/g.138465  ORF Transcript_52784/g.138465 Transcript_52784/m.138465 type:complete len:235 (-) Transcript_52784:29-733(-)
MASSSSSSSSSSPPALPTSYCASISSKACTWRGDTGWLSASRAICRPLHTHIAACPLPWLFLLALADSAAKAAIPRSGASSSMLGLRAASTRALACSWRPGSSFLEMASSQISRTFFGSSIASGLAAAGIAVPRNLSNMSTCRLRVAVASGSSAAAAVKPSRTVPCTQAASSDILFPTPSWSMTTDQCDAKAGTMSCLLPVSTLLSGFKRCDAKACSKFACAISVRIVTWKKCN